MDICHLVRFYLVSHGLTRKIGRFVENLYDPSGPEAIFENIEAFNLKERTYRV